MSKNRNETTSSNLSTLHRKSFLSILNTSLTIPLGLVSVYFVSHYFGPDGIGSFSYALAFVASFSVILDMGTSSSHVKRISEGFDEARCIGTFLSIKLFLALIYGLIIIVAIQLIKSKESSYFIDVVELMIYLLVLSKILGSITLVMTQTFVAKTQTALAVFPALIEKISNVMLKVIACISGFSLVYLAVSNLFGVLIMLLVLLFLFRHKNINYPNLKYIKSYVIFGLPLFILSFADAIMSSMDKLIIGNFLGVYEVGLYSAPQTFIWPSTIIGVSISSLIMPISSSYISEGKVDLAKNLLYKAESYISLFFGPIIIFSIFTSEILVHYFLGNDFSPSVEYVKFFAISSLFFSLSQPFISFLIASEKLKLLASISIISVSLNLFLNLILVPNSLSGVEVLGWGAKGAIISTIFTYFFTYITFRYYCDVKTNRSLIILVIKLTISIFPALFIIETYSLSFLNFLGVISCLFLIIVNTLIYLLILYFLNELTKDQINNIFSTLNPSKMVAYIRQEINE